MKRYKRLTEEDNLYDLKEKYREFNKKYFDNELPKRLSIKYEYMKNSNLYGMTFMYPTIKIRITDKKNLSENQLNHIIVHEMIHVYLKIKGMEDDSHHGEQFKKEIRRINLLNPKLQLFKKIGGIN